MPNHNSARRLAEKQQEYEYMIQQLMALRAMEQAEYEEKMMRQGQHQDHLDFLKMQMEDQRKDRKAWDETKYGTVTNGFFQGFGSSCR
jgi:predicted SprT family Zn-dependent metalloprotease